MLHHMANLETDLPSAAQLQHELMGFIRAFGLLATDHTPCGQAMAPSDAHAMTEIAGGGMSQRELVDRLHLDRSSVSRLVERLVDRGWVRRAAGERDRRTIRLEATPAGELIAASIAETRSSRFSALLDAVPMDRRDGALDAIRLLTQAARLIEE